MRTLRVLLVASCHILSLHGQTAPCPANQRGLKLEQVAGSNPEHDADHPAAFFVKVLLLKDCAPVGNVIVTFSLPASGVTPGAVFPGAYTTATARTDADGYAIAPTMTPNIFAGNWVIHATATEGGVTANLSIAQRNVRASSATASAPVKSKSNAWKYALGILLPGGAVAAVCGTGHCGNGGAKPTDPCTQNPSSCALTIGTPQFGAHK